MTINHKTATLKEIRFNYADFCEKQREKETFKLVEMLKRRSVYFDDEFAPKALREGPSGLVEYREWLFDLLVTYTAAQFPKGPPGEMRWQDLV